MAYFHCLIGGGSSGGGYELTVTCDADFAGTTITCTDGVTTLTQTCPSASPYEVTFEIPNGGDWTISGVVGGQTVSTGVNIPTSASLIATVQQTVTIYSAKEDTISYTDIDGATQTITFASGETSKQVTITIKQSGSSITFISSVAKNPDNLSQDYSKTFAITTSTTELYLMPDAVKTLYWYGYSNSNVESLSTANGWSRTTLGFIAPTYNKNNIYVSVPANNYALSGIGGKNAISGTTIKCITNFTGAKGQISGTPDKNTQNSQLVNKVISAGLSLTSNDISSLNTKYISMGASVNTNGYIYAFWYE